MQRYGFSLNCEKTRFLVPSDELPFRLFGKEAVIVLLLLVDSPLLLGDVFVVCHNITQIRPASLVKIEG